MTADEPMGRSARYRAEARYWRQRYFDLAAGVVAGGNLGLLDLLEEREAEAVRERALELLDHVP